jgi:hypothetical protein
MVFKVFGTGETKEKTGPKVAKGEFAKGLAPSMKEDTWQAVKVSGKSMKGCGSSIQWDRSHRFKRDMDL